MHEYAGQDLTSPLRVADLSAATRARMRDRDFDKFEEKHEGPWSWDYLIPSDDKLVETDDPTIAETRLPTREMAEFLRFDGRDVLLPVGQDHHPYLTIERVIVSVDDRHLVVFLTDSAYDVLYPKNGPYIFNDFMAVCVKLPGEDFYMAIVYHQWLPVTLD